MSCVSYKTKMTTIPDNCMDCTFVLCPLPLTKDEEFRAECKMVRHKDCPLIKVRPLNKNK